MTKQIFLGLDVGSTTVKVAGVDLSGRPIGEAVYLRHDGFETPLMALKTGLAQYLGSDQYAVLGAGTTGSGRELTRTLLEADLSATEILAHAAGVSELTRLGLVYDEAGAPITQPGSVLEIGGQDSKVIIFGPDGLPAYFHMNSICSAGTGEFLKQLADEAEIRLSDFGALALQATAPAPIDSTCTVFARRDFRHLTQKGVPLPDRLMGVCRGLVHNFMKNVVPEGAIRGPVLLQGGIAYNQGVRLAFQQQIGLPVTVTPMHGVVGALGMAWLVRRQLTGRSLPQEAVRRFAAESLADLRFESRIRYCHGCQNGCELTIPQIDRGGQLESLEVLGGRCEGGQNPKNHGTEPQSVTAFSIPLLHHPLPAHRRPSLPGLSPSGRKRPRATQPADGLYFAGLDGGSRGTKYGLLHSRGEAVEVVSVGSLSTGGDAIGACREALHQLAQALPPGAHLSGVGTTGSAGELFRDLITTRSQETADYRSTEILAHYAWASHRHPTVGTVIDVGGNDAKLISVKPGGLDFAMNDKCAAGTGAFLEAVARRFNIPLEQYASVALTSATPARIAGRCAVFGESDVVHKARMGYATPDLLLGVAYAICRTYLTDVGRGRPIRLPVVAQGGAFLNEAVREAFRRTLGLDADQFLVATDPGEVIGAGALGAALLAKGMYQRGYRTGFKGFEAIARNRYRTVTTRCHHPRCRRSCDGVVILLENEQPIAGYRSIDCPLDLFDGMVFDEEARRHLHSLIHASVG